MDLTLTFEERTLLTKILSERQRELLREISRADYHEFKAALRENEKLLEAILSKLNAMEAVQV